MRRGQDDVGVHGLAVEENLARVAVLLKINDVRGFSRSGIEVDFEFHGWRSSCSRRPSCFQRDEAGCGDWSPVKELPDCRLSQYAAAMAAACSVPERGGTAGGE